MDLVAQSTELGGRPTETEISVTSCYTHTVYWIYTSTTKWVVMYTKYDVDRYFNLPVLSRFSLKESIKTGKSTPRAKANPIVSIMHSAEQEEINHDQTLSCL